LLKYKYIRVQLIIRPRDDLVACYIVDGELVASVLRVYPDNTAVLDYSIRNITSDALNGGGQLQCDLRLATTFHSSIREK
jgi:hypothetical protein